MPGAPRSLLMPLLSDRSASSGASAQKVGHMTCMPIQGVLAKHEALHSADAIQFWLTAINGSSACNGAGHEGCAGHGFSGG